MAFIGNELRDDLGHWIRRKLVVGVQGQGMKAQAGLHACGITVDILREQWEMQQQSQLSVRAREFVLFAQGLYL